MATTIYTPVEGFNGTVAGVKFEGGKASTDDDRALAYFKRKGYGIGRKPSSEDAPEPPDPRDASTVHGPQLRDAAVDPRKGDFLPPINAGKANPHGPKVVAPEIHGAIDQRVAPGEVAVDDPDAQEAKETAHTEATVLEEGGEVERPAKSANKPEWVAYAVSQGADPAEAEATNKDDLIATYGDGEA
jgi:hypothetical protein